jgi:hypothetical protein
MGAHRARQTSTVGKVAGRGALTAAAALALTGGTASFAFAAEAPNLDNTTHTLADVAQRNADSVQHLSQDDAPTTVKGAEELVGGHVSAGQHDVSDVTSAVTSDLQTAANDNGIPVGSRATDSERAISGAADEFAGHVHDATGRAAQQADEAAASHGSSLLSFGGSSDDE